MTKTVAVVYSGARVWGGIETYLADLFRYADPQTVRLLLVSMGEWDLNRAGIPAGAQRRLSPRRARPRTVLDIRGILKKERVDLVVSQGAVANAYARVAALFAGVPSLVVTHSVIATDYPAVLKRVAFTVADRLLRPVTTRHVVVSRYLKDELIRSGVRADRITVVYNGVDIECGSGGPGSSSGLHVDGGARLPGGARALSVVSVGRLHAVKSFDVLIRAMKLLPDDIGLTIWGEGEERGGLEALIGSLGLDGRVRLPGRTESIPQALEDADVYVQSSRSEGFGLALVEAMLCGRPVVVAPCGSLPELVEDGRTGLVAAACTPDALAASIQRVLRDGELAARIACAGREVARARFTIERWIEGTTAAFLEACR